jgi:hypothetical protein
MKFGICALLLLFALPAKADSGTVTLAVSGTSDFNISGGYVLDDTFSFTVSAVNSSTFFPTASSTISNVTFTSTGNLGTFAFVPEVVYTGDPQWTNGNGFVFDTALESLNPSGGFIEIELFVPPSASPNPGEYLPQTSSFQIKVVPAPEPEVLLLLVAGLAGIAVLKLRRA